VSLGVKIFINKT